MNRKTFAVLLAFALGSGFTLSAFSQAKPETLVKSRQAKMTLQGKYLYSLIPMAQGKIPYDAKIVARNAEYLNVLQTMAWEDFDPRTADVKETRALPAIYKEPAKFKAAQDRLNTEFVKFMETVKSGNEANTKTAIVELNRTCNACHGDFRSRD